MGAERINYFHSSRGMVRVKTGFSWPAFFFGALWAVAKGLWRFAIAMFVVDVAIWFCSGYAAAQHDGVLALSGFVFQIAYWVFRGRRANAWWRASLLSQGYQPTGTRRVT